MQDRIFIRTLSCLEANTDLFMSRCIHPYGPCVQVRCLSKPSEHRKSLRFEDGNLDSSRGDGDGGREGVASSQSDAISLRESASQCPIHSILY